MNKNKTNKVILAITIALILVLTGSYFYFEKNLLIMSMLETIGYFSTLLGTGLSIYSLLQIESIKDILKSELIKQKILLKISFTIEKIDSSKREIFRYNEVGDEDGKYFQVLDEIKVECDKIKAHKIKFDLKELEKMKEELGTITRHEIINILTSLRGQLEKIKNELDDDVFSKKGDDNG